MMHISKLCIPMEILKTSQSTVEELGIKSYCFWLNYKKVKDKHASVILPSTS